MKYAGIVATEYGLQFATASSLHRQSARVTKLIVAKPECRTAFGLPEWQAQLGAAKRMAEAVDRLVAVEKEVERG